MPVRPPSLRSIAAFEAAARHASFTKAAGRTRPARHLDPRRRIGNDMNDYPRWAALAERIVERPAVQRALATEELTVEAFLEAA